MFFFAIWGLLERIPIDTSSLEIAFSGYYIYIWYDICIVSVYCKNKYLCIDKHGYTTKSTNVHIDKYKYNYACMHHYHPACLAMSVKIFRHVTTIHLWYMSLYVTKDFPHPPQTLNSGTNVQSLPLIQPTRKHIGSRAVWTRQEN